jgi:hypothetical protein
VSVVQCKVLAGRRAAVGGKKWSQPVFHFFQALTFTFT